MPNVKDLMTTKVVTTDISTTVLDAAILMCEKKRGCLVIMDDDRPVGIVTERDFVRRVVAKTLPLTTRISEIMTTPLITISPISSLRNAARLMVENKVRRLPVVENETLVGIIVVADFARHLSKRTIIEDILDAMARYPAYVVEETLDVIEQVVENVYPNR